MSWKKRSLVNMYMYKCSHLLREYVMYIVIYMYMFEKSSFFGVFIDPNLVQIA